MGSILSDVGSAIGYAASGAERGRESRDAGNIVSGYQNLDANAGPNAYGNIQTNPANMAAASQALGQLQGVAGGSGLTPQASSALQASQLSNAQQQGSAVQAQLANAQRSGTLNSGRALAGTLGADQAATNANAQAGAQATSNSEAQRVNAMGQVGQLGAQLNNQQFGQQAQIAQGTNAYNQQNVQNQFQKQAGITGGYQDLIGLNQQQAQGIQNVGSKLGDAAGQAASAVATGGASLAMPGS